MNILVVDDSEDSRELMAAALNSSGYKNVICAASAAEAFGVLGIARRKSGAQADVDIVLLDIMMPEIDGIEACALIRSHDRFQDTPIIMISALDDMDSLSNAFIAGANDYIAKPVNRIELHARVRAALKLKGELEQRRARERELLQFLSNWGDRRADHLIDEVTGFFVGEVAEVYLTAGARFADDRGVSVITLSIDRVDAIKASSGAKAARAIQAHVAGAIRRTLATVGVVAASYRNGLIVVIAPGFDASSAERLARAMCDAVAQLGITDREFIAADHLTASAAVMTAHAEDAAERIKLLVRAISGVQRRAAAGGSRISVNRGDG